MTPENSSLEFPDLKSPQDFRKSLHPISHAARQIAEAIDRDLPNVECLSFPTGKRLLAIADFLIPGERKVVLVRKTGSYIFHVCHLIVPNHEKRDDDSAPQIILTYTDLDEPGVTLVTTFSIPGNISPEKYDSISLELPEGFMIYEWLPPAGSPRDSTFSPAPESSP